MRLSDCEGTTVFADKEFKDYNKVKEMVLEDLKETPSETKALRDILMDCKDEREMNDVIIEYLQELNYPVEILYTDDSFIFYEVPLSDVVFETLRSEKTNFYTDETEKFILSSDSSIQDLIKEVREFILSNN